MSRSHRSSPFQVADLQNPRDIDTTRLATRAGRGSGSYQYQGYGYASNQGRRRPVPRPTPSSLWYPRWWPGASFLEVPRNQSPTYSIASAVNAAREPMVMQGPCPSHRPRVRPARLDLPSSAARQKAEAHNLYKKEFVQVVVTDLVFVCLFVCACL